MLKWIKRKLGILSLQTRVTQLEKEVTGVYKEQNRLEKKTRIGKKPLRADEVNRAKKRKRKPNFV
jgi:hypothetical protein